MIDSTPSSCCSACAPEPAVTTSWPPDLSSSLRAKSSEGSSSTTSTRAIAAPLRLRFGQHDVCGRALAGLALVVERAAVLRDGRAHQRDAQAIAVIAGSEEGRADALRRLARHAGPGVADDDARVPVALGDVDVDAAAAGRSFDRIGDQVVHRLAQPPRIAVDARLA